MRVLWFTSSPCGYLSHKGNRGYNGGGWMDSVEREIKKNPEISLGVCFPMNGQKFKSLIDKVEYYPIRHHSKSIKDKIVDAIKYKDVKRDELVWPHYINQLKNVINDFRPDVIEIFGSEIYIELAALVTTHIPKLMHIQGILSIYHPVYYPYGISPFSNYFQDWNPKNIYKRFQYDINWKRSCYREQNIFKHVNHVIGRTEWDKAGATILNPNAIYHYGGEILRPVFYEHGERQMPEKLTIVTTSSGAMYKGFDFILKVANILKNIIKVDFEWNVYGNVNPKFFEKVTGINHQNVNIKLRGIASAEQLRDSILHSTLYFQPSYIENSPNSVCEAQILGVPPIATNVGGTSSLIEDGETGFLVPAGEPYYSSYQIAKIYKDEELNITMGKNAKEVALKRHDREIIVTELIQTYQSVISSK